MRRALSTFRFSTPASTKFSTEVTWGLTQDLNSLRGLAPVVSEVFIPFQSQKSCSDILHVTKDLINNDFVPVPHVPVRRFRSSQELEQFVKDLRALGIRKVLVVGGDDRSPKGPFHGTLQAMQSGLLDGFETVGIAAHANGNPMDQCAEQSFTEKLAWSDQSRVPLFAVTNLCLHPEVLENFVRKISSRLDVYAGVPGPCSLKSLGIFSKLCLSGNLPPQITHASPAALASGMFSPEVFVDHVAKLTPRVHLYSFGGLKKTLEWIAHHRK